MSQSKKTKKKRPKKKSLKSYVVITKQYYNEYVRIIHKILTMAGIDPAEFDVLTKRTKQQLMLIKYTPYRILAEKDSKVPRVYIRIFNHVMTVYEKQSFFGDPQYNVRFIDYLTYGLSFIFAIRNHQCDDEICSVGQHELLDKIKTPLLKYLEENTQDNFLVRSVGLMKIMLMWVSMPNYRYYTAEESGVRDSQKGRIQNQLKVSSFEPTKRYFIVRGQKHPSYQLWHYAVQYDVSDPNPIKTEIPSVLLEEPDVENGLTKIMDIEAVVKLPVFIQNHALHRIRQRIDCMDNIYVNKILSLSFSVTKIITAKNGQRLICAIDENELTIGYFPFVIQENAVLILSFLPMSSPITPEGTILFSELGISIHDSNYIRLDKLSFYVETDFETLPKLKNALLKANMWHLTEIKSANPSERKDDQILKRFFAENTSYVSSMA